MSLRRQPAVGVIHAVPMSQKKPNKSLKSRELVFKGTIAIYMKGLLIALRQLRMEATARIMMHAGTML